MKGALLGAQRQQEERSSSRWSAQVCKEPQCALPKPGCLQRRTGDEDGTAHAGHRARLTVGPDGVLQQARGANGEALAVWGEGQAQ